MNQNTFSTDVATVKTSKVQDIAIQNTDNLDEVIELYDIMAGVRMSMSEAFYHKMYNLCIELMPYDVASCSDEEDPESWMIKQLQS